MIVNAAIIGFLLVLNVWLVWTFVRDYRGAIGTPWQRALTAAKESAVILWQKALMFGAGLAGLIVKAADYLGDPQLSAQIQSLLKPEYVTIFLIVVASVTIYARKRTL